MNSVDNAYENLANAIIIRACEDYAALKRGNVIPGVQMSELTAFFKGSLATILCGDVNPAYILRRVDAGDLPEEKRGRKKSR